MKYDIVNRKGCTITIRVTDDMMDIIESLRKEIPASKQLYPPATFSEAVRHLLQRGIESHVSKTLFDSWRRAREERGRQPGSMGLAERIAENGVGKASENRPRSPTP